jgi:hypothetical protein
VRNIFTSQPRTANDHDQRKENKKVHQKYLFITGNIPVCSEKRSIIEILPTNDSHRLRNATHVSLCLPSTSSSALALPQQLDLDPYETVDGTRILLVATEPRLRLVRYIIPVPVLGLGRIPSPPGPGLGKGDCERAVTGVDNGEVGLEPGPDMNSVCVPPGETASAGARLGPVFTEIVRSLS